MWELTKEFHEVGLASEASWESSLLGRIDLGWTSREETTQRRESSVGEGRMTWDKEGRGHGGRSLR